MHLLKLARENKKLIWNSENHITVPIIYYFHNQFMREQCNFFKFVANWNSVSTQFKNWNGNIIFLSFHNFLLKVSIYLWKYLCRTDLKHWNLIPIFHSIHPIQGYIKRNNFFWINFHFPSFQIRILYSEKFFRNILGIQKFP